MSSNITAWSAAHVDLLLFAFVALVVVSFILMIRKDKGAGDHLDYNFDEKYRNLPFVGTLAPHVYAG